MFSLFVLFHLSLSYKTVSSVRVKDVSEYHVYGCRSHGGKVCVLAHFSSFMTGSWGPDLIATPEPSFQWEDCHNRSRWVIPGKLAARPLPPPTSRDTSPQISEPLCFRCHGLELLTAIGFLGTNLKTLQIKSAQPDPRNCFIYFLFPKLAMTAWLMEGHWHANERNDTNIKPRFQAAQWQAGWVCCLVS